jgi:endogenous inhibitor of DNA gyrase (YacG/DUF329 family)
MAENVDIPRVPRCPICSKSTVEQFKPFCSRRCADVDLNRWLSGVYAVPTEEAEDEDGQANDSDDKPVR